MMVDANSNQSNTSKFRRSPQSNMSSTPRGVMKSVSFSSEVSVFTQNADDDATITTTAELAAAEEDNDVSPRSLFSGRWIEDVLDSSESRGVAVVEVKNTSPRMTSDSKSSTISKASATDEPNNPPQRYRKTLLQRHEPPLTTSESNLISELSKSEATMSPLESLKIDTSDDTCASNLSSPMNSCKSSKTAEGRPVSQTFDFELINSGSLGQDDEQDKLSVYCNYDIGPISKRGQMWERIVDSLRAVLVFIGYTFVVAREPLCGENAKELVVGVKLGGVFVLCCLSLFAANDQRGRMGWKKLTEVVCSRKTFLLIMYIVAWSYTVSALAGVCNGRAPTRIAPECTKKNRYAIPWATNVNELPVLGNSQIVENLLGINERSKPDINAVSLDLLLDIEPEEMAPTGESYLSLEMECSDPFDDFFRGNDVMTPETRPVQEPQTLPTTLDEEDASLTGQAELVYEGAERNRIAPKIRIEQESRPALSIVDEAAALVDDKVIMNADGDDDTIAVIQLNSITPDTRQAIAPRIVPISWEKTNSMPNSPELNELFVENAEIEELSSEEMDEIHCLYSVSQPAEMVRFNTETGVEHQHHPVVDDDDDAGIAMQNDRPDQRQELLPLKTHVVESEAESDADQKLVKNSTMEVVDDATNELIGDKITKKDGDASDTGSNVSSPPTNVEILAEEAFGNRIIHQDEALDEETENSQGEAKLAAQASHGVGSVSLTTWLIPSFTSQTPSKSVKKDSMKYDSPSSPSSDDLVDVTKDIDLSEVRARMTEDETIRYTALGKAVRLANFLSKHVTALLIGNGGRYKNQAMMDALYEVWMRRFWS